VRASSKVTALLNVETRNRRTKVTAKLTGFVFPEGDLWTAYCRELDLASCADTHDEAAAALKEAVELFFETCIEAGTLDRVLRGLGWVCFHQGRPTALEGVRPLRNVPPTFMIDRMKTRGQEWSSRVSFG